MTPPDLDYRAVFGAIPVPATLIDADGIILDVNGAFLAIARRAGSDLKPEDRIGKPANEFVADAFHAEWEAFVGELLAGGNAAPLRQVATDGMGREFLQEIRGHAIRGSSGSVVGAVILRDDVTEEVLQAERLEDTTRLLTAFQRIGELVVSSLDQDVVLDTIAEEIVRAGIFRSLMVALVDQDDGTVTVRRSLVCQRDAEGRPIPGTALRGDPDVVGFTYDRDDPNITAETARRGEPMIVEPGDERLDKRVDAKPENKVAFFIPVKQGDRVLAVLATACYAPQRDDTLQRIEMMRPLLNQAAIALDHARLFEENRRAVRAQKVNLAVQRVRNSVLQMRDEAGWADVVDQLSGELTGLVQHAACGIQLVAGDGSMVGYSSGKGALQGHPFHEAPPPVRRALETWEPQYRRTRAEMAEACDDVGLVRVGAHSVVDVPFQGGTLAVNSEAEDAFSDDDIAVLQAFAAVMSEAHQRLQELRVLAQKELQLQQAQKMEAVGQLTAGVAHNFNNVLQGVIGNLELALLDAGPAVQPAIEAALQSTQRAGEVVQQLMVFSREDQHRPRRAVDIGAVIRDTEAICRKTFDRRIHLAVARRSVSPTLGDAPQLQQVFLNLCLNARDAVTEYSHSIPSIRISWEEVQVDERHAPSGAEPGPYLRVDVVDNGQGMDLETQKRIFEPFFSTKPVGKGTGLGLSTAFAIVREHDGWIECESQPGAGARFSVFLPAATPGDEGPPPEPRDSASGPTDATVLVVDDEDMVRKTAQKMLELRGYSVLTAADGEQALEIVRRHGDDIALILLDQSMPGLSGREVLQHVRRHAPDTRVIIFTGFPSDVEDFEGADDLVRKPFTLDGLVSKVRGVLDRTSGGGS